MDSSIFQGVYTELFIVFSDCVNLKQAPSLDITVLVGIATKDYVGAIVSTQAAECIYWTRAKTSGKKESLTHPKIKAIRPRFKNTRIPLQVSKNMFNIFFQSLMLPCVLEEQ